MGNFGVYEWIVCAVCAAMVIGGLLFLPSALKREYIEWLEKEVDRLQQYVGTLENQNERFHTYDDQLAYGRKMVAKYQAELEKATKPKEKRIEHVKSHSPAQCADAQCISSQFDAR